MTDIELITKGMDILVRELGIVEAETFISCIKQDHFDYTKWRQDKFEELDIHDLGQSAAEYVKRHPFKGNAQII